MSKKLFALILCVILFQYVYNGACIDKTDPHAENDCQDLDTSALSKKCSFEEEGKPCKEVVKNCEEIKSEATDDLCKELEVSNNKVCLKAGDGCKEIQKCNSATGNDDAECKNFPVETKGNVCKKDTAQGSKKCKEVKEESTESKASTQSGNNLTFSLAFLILLFLF